MRNRRWLHLNLSSASQDAFDRAALILALELEQPLDADAE
jgi:hypothetical protein